MIINKPFLEECLSEFFARPHMMGFKVMTEGKENTSVQVTLANEKSYILRLWGETHSYMGVRRQSDIEGELDFMIHCYDQGIPVPRVYISRTGKRFEKTPSGTYYVVMDYITGNLPSNPTPAMIGQVAQTMARMHKLAETYRFPTPRAWPGSVLDVALERLRRLPEASIPAEYKVHIKRLQTAFERALAATDFSDVSHGPIHGDIFWENIKFEGDELRGVFDFDDCRDSYSLEDITKSLTIDLDDVEHGFFGVHGEHVRVFLDNYSAIRPLTELEKQLVPLFLTASYLSRLARYLSKTENGTLVYLERVAGYRDQYLRSQPYFLPAS